MRPVVSAMSHLRFCRATLTRDSDARQNRRCDMALIDGCRSVAIVSPAVSCAEMAEPIKMPFGLHGLGWVTLLHIDGSVVFDRWRQSAPHLIQIRASLGLPESTTHTASQSVQPFSHSLRHNVVRRAWARPFP